MYEIDHILGHKGDGDGRSYLIRWKGYGPEGDTWEPVSNIHTDEVIQDYLSKIQPASTVDDSDDQDQDEKEEVDVSADAAALPVTQHRASRRRRRRS